MKETERIKLFGLRRSGTNFLAKLLRANCHKKVLDSHTGWKHGCMGCNAESDPTIVTVRHPFSWVPSTWRILKHLDRYKWVPDVKQFVLWKNSVHKSAGEGDSEMIHKWSFFCGYWLYKQLIHRPKVLIVRYEDLVTDPKGVLKYVCRLLDIEIKDASNISYREDYVGPHPTGKDHVEIVRYQQSCAFMDYWDDDMVKALKMRIDDAVFKTLGYLWERPYCVENDLLTGILKT